MQMEIYRKEKDHTEIHTRSKYFKMNICPKEIDMHGMCNFFTTFVYPRGCSSFLRVQYKGKKFAMMFGFKLCWVMAIISTKYHLWKSIFEYFIQRKTLDTCFRAPQKY